jgi:hypothetical protein
VQGTTSTAAPLPSYPSDQAPKSAQDPAPNPKLTASQSPSAQNTAEDTSLPGPKVSDPVAQDPAADLPQEPAGQAPNETPKTTKGNKNNVWPPPASDFDIPETTDALSILKSALASAQATGAADPQDSSPSQHQSTGQQEDIEGSYPDGTEDPSDLSDSINHASGDPSKPEQVVAEWTHDGEAFTAISTDGSAVIKGGDDVATVAAGSVETFRGQSVSVPLDGSHAKVDDSALSFSPVEMATGDGLGNTPSTATVLTAAAIWTHENEVFTTILTDGSAVVHGGGGVATVEPGKVETFEGQAISVPLEGNLVKVDDQVLSFSTVEMTTATGSQQDDTLSTAVFTASGRAITAMVHGSSLVLQAAGTATTIAHGAEVTFVGQTVSFPKSLAAAAMRGYRPLLFGHKEVRPSQRRCREILQSFFKPLARPCAWSLARQSLSATGSTACQLLVASWCTTRHQSRSIVLWQQIQQRSPQHRRLTAIPYPHSMRATLLLSSWATRPSRWLMVHKQVLIIMSSVRNRPAGWSSSMELHWQRVLVYLSDAHPTVEAAVILETLLPHLGVR